MPDTAPLPSRLKEALGTLSARLLVAFLLPTLLFLALTGTAIYALARNILEDELGTSLSALAAATASQVSAERMLTIEPGDDAQGTRTWRNLRRLLTEVRDASGLRRVYVVDTRGRVLADTQAGVAHEVSNPIGGLALFSELLEEDLKAGAHVEAGEHVGRIQREVEYLQRIVEDFLSFAHIV